MTDVPLPWGRVALAVVRTVAPRPWLWPSAIGALVRLARTGWWRRWPPAPLPGPGYWRFRTVTAYGGDGGQVPPGEDVVAYLRWCRRTSHLRG
jgi:hypothetical protein